MNIQYFTCERAILGLCRMAEQRSVQLIKAFLKRILLHEKVQMWE